MRKWYSPSAIDYFYVMLNYIYIYMVYTDIEHTLFINIANYILIIYRQTDRDEQIDIK